MIFPQIVLPILYLNLGDLTPPDFAYRFRNPSGDMGLPISRVRPPRKPPFVVPERRSSLAPACRILQKIRFFRDFSGLFDRFAATNVDAGPFTVPVRRGGLGTTHERGTVFTAIPTLFSLARRTRGTLFSERAMSIWGDVPLTA